MYTNRSGSTYDTIHDLAHKATIIMSSSLYILLADALTYTRCVCAVVVCYCHLALKPN